jgi:hypothetical protein
MSTFSPSSHRQHAEATRRWLDALTSADTPSIACAGVMLADDDWHPSASVPWHRRSR